jgi:mannose-6-phosphate isomerase-like protein (cupin superfamily)
MRTIGIGIAVTLLSAAAVIQLSAQQPAGKQADAMKLFTTSSEIQAMIAKAKSDHKEGQALISQRILGLAPYTASLEYRASVGPAAIHETEAEFFYVIDGAGTMVTGGKLVGEQRNGVNLTGTAIEGGTPRQVAKGDFIVVPEGTGHWFSKIDQTLVLMSLHVPRPVPAAK